MGRFAKILAPIMAMVVGATGLALPIQAAETDYQKYYNEAMASLEGVDVRKASPLIEEAVRKEIPRFNTYLDVPFGIAQIETLYPDALQSDHDIFGSYGGTFIGKDGLVALLAKYDPSTMGDWDENQTVQDLLKKNTTDLLQQAKADERYGKDAEYTAKINTYQDTYDRGVRILRRDLPGLGVSNVSVMTAEQLVQAAKSLPEYKQFGSKEDEYTAKNLYSAYSSVRGDINCFSSEVCNGNLSQEGLDTVKQSCAELIAQAKLIDSNFTVDLSSAKIEASALTPAEDKKKARVPDTGNKNQEDKSASVIKMALTAIAGIAMLLGIATVAKRYVFSPLKRK